MTADGPLGDEEARSDLLVAQALGDEVRDLSFSLPELLASSLGCADADTLRRQAVRDRDRAGEALYLLLSEQTARHLDAETAVAIVDAGNRGMLAGDAMTLVANEFGPRARGCPDGATALRLEVRSLLAGLTGLGERLDPDSRTTRSSAPVSAAALRAAALGCLHRWANDATAGRGALAVVISREWALNLARLEADLEQPVSMAVKASRIPWWR